MFSRLSQYLDSYILWNQILFDQCTQEFILCFRSSRKTYFDLFKTNFYKKFKKFNFLLQTHRDYQCLIAVTKIHGAPDRCFVYIFFFCPFHAFDRRHEILSLILAWIHHFFSSSICINIVFVSRVRSVKWHKKISHPRRLICKRRKIRLSYAVPLLFMTNVIHSWDTEWTVILISSPYNGGHRLHLLSYDFRQLLKGEFHNFHPLLLSCQQFSVLRAVCTIPYRCIWLIIFQKILTYIGIIRQE